MADDFLTKRLFSIVRKLKQQQIQIYHSGQNVSAKIEDGILKLRPFQDKGTFIKKRTIIVSLFAFYF